MLTYASTTRLWLAEGPFVCRGCEQEYPDEPELSRHENQCEEVAALTPARLPAGALAALVQEQEAAEHSVWQLMTGRARRKGWMAGTQGRRFSQTERRESRVTRMFQKRYATW